MAASAAGETVYETESPTIPGTKPKPDKPTNNSKDDSSEADAEKSDSPAGGGGTESGGGGTGGGSPETGTDGGTGQTSQGGGSKAIGDISQAEKVQASPTSEPKPVENAGTISDGGGSSSPLVPILIAIAALAAVSIGAVVIRQRRRGGPGTPVSPNAS